MYFWNTVTIASEGIIPIIAAAEIKFHGVNVSCANSKTPTGTVCACGPVAKRKTERNVVHDSSHAMVVADRIPGSDTGIIIL
jgi:hypothetical protein